MNINLIGMWKKTLISKCNEMYPDYLEFHHNGLYNGKKERIGDFSMWDAGEFQIVSETQIKISTANDAELIYDFSILGDKLIFIDSNKCELQYQRI